ncbi:hypothetical protein RV17_GL002132 [Enterococcus thailandicus]|nr:hypothetical protein RV17_GL002132 [Enterococcus thailandicus]
MILATSTSLIEVIPYSVIYTKRSLRYSGGFVNQLPLFF